jgi:deoxycytidylate deaminase
MCRRKIVNAGVARVVGLLDNEVKEIEISTGTIKEKENN